MGRVNYDPLYVQYVYYFNVKHDYYECHEVLEELWVKTGRVRFYQGMLQAAVALYHFRNGNVAGAKKLFYGALDKLKSYDRVAYGIDLAKFQQDCVNYVDRLERFATQPFPFYTFPIQIKDESLQKLVAEIKKTGTD